MLFFVDISQHFNGTTYIIYLLDTKSIYGTEKWCYTTVI